MGTLENIDENKIFFCLFTTSILAKLNTWCFKHSNNIRCSLLVNPSHTDESWARRNTCMWTIYVYIYVIMKTMCPPGYHHNGFVANHALGHMISHTYIYTHIYTHIYTYTYTYFFIKYCKLFRELSIKIYYLKKEDILHSFYFNFANQQTRKNK